MRFLFSALLVAMLFAVPSTRAVAQSNISAPVHDCDRLAASIEDPLRKADGALFDDIDAGKASEACKAALKKYPTEARFSFQLGRAQHKAQAQSKALDSYRKAAQRDYGPASHYIGLMYWNGDGVEKNRTEARMWFRRGADQGFPPSMVNVGLFYARGTGVTKDYAEALRWYRKAANAGLSVAMNNVGVAYARGHGVTKDYSEAVKWYRKAAQKNHPLGMRNLGQMYEAGRGVPKSRTEAIGWYRKAAAKGNKKAAENLRRLGQPVPAVSAKGSGSTSSSPPTSSSGSAASSETIEKLPEIKPF